MLVLQREKALSEEAIERAIDSRAWGDFDLPRAATQSRLAADRRRCGIVAISRRLGHAKPDITLRIYAHVFRKDDSEAAAAINAALQR
jgi:integrase